MSYALIGNYANEYMWLLDCWRQEDSCCQEDSHPEDYQNQGVDYDNMRAMLASWNAAVLFPGSKFRCSS